MEQGRETISKTTEIPSAPKPQAVSDDELFTIAEIAAYLKLSQRTAWRWCKSGRLPAFKIGHQWRVAQSDLEEFIRGRIK